MASNARCLCFFFLLALSFSLQIQARESKFFSKLTHHYLRRKTQENPESISGSPAQSSSLAPAPAPESDVVEHGYGLYGHEPVISSDGAGEVKYVDAKGLGKKTFRDFVMAYPNDNGNGWNGKKNKNENEKKGMSDTRFLENGKYYYDVNNERNENENKKQGMSEYVEENSFPENKENGNEHEYETEKHGMGEKKYLVNGKYYSGYVTGENGNEKQGRDAYVDNENEGNGNEYETEKQGMNQKRYLVNGKYYSGYVTGSENGNGNGKLGMNEYVEEEKNFPEIKENGNAYETEKQGMGDKRYLVNGKYYSGYVTGSENGNENEKQGMGEYVEENNFPENKGYGNEYEIEKQGRGEKKYFVNGKYYSGYVTGSEHGNENEKHWNNEYVEEENSFPENRENGNEFETEKQGMGEKKYFVNGKYYSGYVTTSQNGNKYEKQGINEHVEENNFPENKGNGNGYESEKQGMGEKYVVNGKYYSGYVTGSEHENENGKQGKNEYVEENSFPENRGSRNEFETEKQGTGEKMYSVNGKYYSGYVTRSENGNENEKQRMSEYVKDENSSLENKWNENETEHQRNGKNKYLVNGKYYYGYVTGENRHQNNQNYNSYEDFNKKNEYTNGNNEDEFYNGNNEYEKEQEYVP